MEKLISEDVESINELVEKLRLGEIEGSIEITINNNGKINKILIKKQHEGLKELSEAIKKVKLNQPDLSHADFSDTDLTGSDFSGLDLHEADFSYSKIRDSSLSGSNLVKAKFYKTELDRADLSNSYGVNLSESYMTGSVNLYSTIPATDVTNPYDGGTSHEDQDEDEHALHPVDMDRIQMKKRKAY